MSALNVVDNSLTPCVDKPIDNFSGEAKRSGYRKTPHRPASGYGRKNMVITTLVIYTG